MATSDTPKFPRFIRSTIILPPKETDHVYDANGKTMDEELNCMEVDGVDPGGIHVPDYDFVSLWKETKGPYKVREVKDLQAVIDSGSLTIPQLARVKAWRAAAETGMVLCVEDKQIHTPATPTASLESGICDQKNCTGRRSSWIDAMNAQFSSPENTKFREEFMLHENLGCIHHERFTDPLRSTSTLPSSTSLSTESSTIADNRAKEPGYEMVGNHEAVPEEAREVFTFNKGKGMEEDYVEVLKL